MTAINGGPLREALSLCASHIRSIAIFSALINLAFLGPTLYMLGVYDLVVPSGSRATLAFFTVALVATLVVLVILEQVRSRILSAAGLRLDRVFVTRLYGEAMRRPAGRLAPKIGQLIRESDLIRAAVTGPAVLALMDAPWTPIYVLVCFLVHPLIGVLAGSASIVLLCLAVWNERVTRMSSRRALDAASATFITQDAAGAASEVVRALGMDATFLRRFQDARASSHLPQLAAARATARIGGLIRFLRLLLQSGALALGAWLAIERQISAGSIFAASMLAARALSPMDQVVAQWRSLSQAITSFTALEPHLVVQPHHERTCLPVPAPIVSLQHVTVVAPARDRILLHDITITIEGGQILGVVGPSGAGKSTLLEVIANARETDQGDVRIDGARYSDWEPHDLGKFIGYLPQETALFPGSVKENISRFGGTLKPDDTQIDVDAVTAARDAGVHELILALPKGYDYQISGNGRSLSAGQRQRLGLARALYGNPVLLVLDEPDSALDPLGEVALGVAIRRARERGAAVVVAAHNPNLLSMADLLAVVEDGRLKMFGPASEVMKALQAVVRPDPAATRAALAIV